MTTEEKAKAYDKALEMAKNVLETELHESGAWAIQKIFPQLKESEDERIRKEIIDDIRNLKVISSEEYIKKADIWIAWLEKQKEQKPLEWSEEDKENLGLVIECIYKYYPEPVMKYKLKDWLKSLRPKPKQDWIKEQTKNQ